MGDLGVGNSLLHIHLLESCDCSDGKHMGKMNNKSMNMDDGDGGAHKPAETKKP